MFFSHSKKNQNNNLKDIYSPLPQETEQISLSFLNYAEMMDFIVINSIKWANIKETAKKEIRPIRGRLGKVIYSAAVSSIRNIMLPVSSPNLHQGHGTQLLHPKDV